MTSPGIHLALSRNPKSYRTGARGCCTIEDANDARRAADVIGIPFYVWDLSERFHEDVVEDFLSEYAEGRTPNPCLRCNEKIKFAAVLDRAIALGFDAVVTGHYAQLAAPTDGLIEMHRAEDMARTRATCSAYSPRSSSPTRCSRWATPPSPRSARRPRGAGWPSPPSRTATTSASSVTATPVAGSPRSSPRRLGSTAVARSSPPTARCSGRTRVRGATRSGSARACASGRPRPTGSRATCSTSSRSRHRHRGSACRARGRRAHRDQAALVRRRTGRVAGVHGPAARARRRAPGGRASLRGRRRRRRPARPGRRHRPGQAVVVYDGTRVVGSATISATRRVAAESTRVTATAHRRRVDAR